MVGAQQLDITTIAISHSKKQKENGQEEVANVATAGATEASTERGAKMKSKHETDHAIVINLLPFLFLFSSLFFPFPPSLFLFSLGSGTSCLGSNPVLSPIECPTEDPTPAPALSLSLQKINVDVMHQIQPLTLNAKSASMMAWGAAVVLPAWAPGEIELWNPSG